jgi:2-dehydropantoate 2-reductase
MKIAVVGCGAVGSYYGGRLCQAGQEVHFLLRSDYEVVRRQGVFIRSPAGDFHVRPRSARAPADIGASDLVLIGLKTTANDQLPRLLPPLVGNGTAVLTLQNGLGNVEALARLVPPEQILGGLAFVCLNRTAPGAIHHLDHGRIVVGEFARPAAARTHALAAVFQKAGVSCAVTENLARSQWEKLVWNIPFNGLGVASAAGYEAVRAGAAPPAGPLAPCRTTDQLLAEVRWSGLVRDLMLEIIAIANRLGFQLPATLVEHFFAQTRTMGAYKPSTLLDFERGQPLELDSIFLEPWRRARSAGVAAPCLEALGGVLAALGERQGGGAEAQRE